MLLRRSSQKMDLLKKVPMFSNLSQRHLREIGKHADQVKVEEGGSWLSKRKKGGNSFLLLRVRPESRRMRKSSDNCQEATFLGRYPSSMEKPGQQQLLLKPI